MLGVNSSLDAVEWKLETCVCVKCGASRTLSKFIDHSEESENSLVNAFARRNTLRQP